MIMIIYFHMHSSGGIPVDLSLYLADMLYSANWDELQFKCVLYNR